MTSHKSCSDVGQRSIGHRSREGRPRERPMLRLTSPDAEAILEVNALLAELREELCRRPRLQQEFDRVGLP